MTAYAQKHQGGDAVARYQRKLANRIDRLRHDEEVALIALHARGALYDCTIGIGRFVNALPRVTSYHGADLSQEFVDHVTTTFASVTPDRADLTQGIGRPDSSFDTVMCLRSLSAIGQLDRIIPDMVRIAKPGGIIIIDYGRRPTQATLYGNRVTIDGENIDEVIQQIPADIVEEHRCDGLLTSLKSPLWLFRLVNGRFGGLLSDSMLLRLDRSITPVIWQRRIIVLRKRLSA